MKKFTALILLLIFCLLSFTACSEDKSYSSFNYFSCNTEIFIKDVSTDEKYQEFITKSEEILENVSNSSSIDNGTLKQLNDAPIDTEILITKTLYEILSSAIELYEFTNKKFNPALYPISSLWKFTPDKYIFGDTSFIPPTDSEISLALLNTDFSSLSIYVNNGNFYAKKSKNITIDLGGIAKGFALKKLGELYQNYSFSSGYISLGSSAVATFNTSSILLRNPRSTNIDTVAKISLNQTDYISTSGDYERYHLYNGNRYSHIIDSSTGKPANTGIISATIISNDAVKADAVSTALCTLSLTDAKFFINENLSNDTVVLIYENLGTYTVYTNKIEKVSLTNNSFALKSF